MKPKHTLDHDLEQLGHHINIEDGVYRCYRCGQSCTKATRRDMVMHGPCPGPSLWGRIAGGEIRPARAQQGSDICFLGSKIHETHKIGWHRGLIYCIKCGRYAGERVAQLKALCPLKPNSEKAADGLNRIKQGLHPSPSGKFPLGESTPPPNHLHTVLKNFRATMEK